MFATVLGMNNAAAVVVVLLALGAAAVVIPAIPNARRERPAEQR
jgi:hypothetical protein